MRLFQFHAADAKAEPEFFETRITRQTEKPVERLLAIPKQVAVRREEIVAYYATRDVNGADPKLACDHLHSNEHLAASVGFRLCGIAGPPVIDVCALKFGLADQNFHASRRQFGVLSDADLVALPHVHPDEPR